MKFKIISKFEYNFLKKVEEDYYSSSKENQNLKECLMQEKSFSEKLKVKLQETHTCVYSIKKDRNERDTYILVQDYRKPFIDKNGFSYMKGDLNIFVMNTDVYGLDLPYRYIDVPHLLAKFQENHIHIYELHSDINNYENRGYGTMMIDTLKEIGKNSNCESISGCLSSVDADTEQKKENRNRFYKSRGFTLKFDDEECKSGRFYLKLIQ